jgi:hypothetical protein
MTETRYTTERCDSLISYPGNARRGDVPRIRESLENLGQYKPVIVQLSTRYVLAGNHTLAAAIDLGWDEVDVRWVDCDDVTAKRINLVDNRSADLGEYNQQALAELLRSLEGDYTATGYEEDYLTNLLEEMANNALTGEGDEWDTSDGADVDAGTLLALTDVSVAEPLHQPLHGSGGNSASTSSSWPSSPTSTTSGGTSSTAGCSARTPSPTSRSARSARRSPCSSSSPTSTWPGTS